MASATWSPQSPELLIPVGVDEYSLNRQGRSRYRPWPRQVRKSNRGEFPLVLASEPELPG